MKQMNKNPVITNTSMHANSLQWCLTLCNPIDYSPQIPLSMGFSRQEYRSGLPFPPPEDLPDARIDLCLLHWQGDSLLLSHLGSPSQMLDWF